MFWIILLFLFLAIFFYIAGRANSRHRERTLVVSGRFVGAPPRPPEFTEEGHRVFYMQVHGITHKNDDGTSRQQIIKRCRDGEEVLLVREPENRFDSGAIKICRKNGEQLGYWPADGGRTASDLARGWTYRATIDEVYRFEDNPRMRGVKLRVEVLTMSRATEARSRKKKESQAAL